jgi:Zn-dependent metalloprotease
LWDGKSHQWFFGDGMSDGYTRDIEVVAHEFTHGVTAYSAVLEAGREADALNESISDVFAAIMKQYLRDESVDDADWLHGSAFYDPKNSTTGVRSLKLPGTACDGDEGIEHKKDFKDEDEWEHENSGISSRAFYLASIEIGGKSWEKPGRIWYNALIDPQLRKDDEKNEQEEKSTKFSDFGKLTCAKASQLYGDVLSNHVKKAWEDVGVFDLTFSLHWPTDPGHKFAREYGLIHPIGHWQATTISLGNSITSFSTVPALEKSGSW